MKLRNLKWLLTLSAATAAMVPAVASAETFIARLNGFEETPAAISTPASGQFVFNFNPATSTGNYVVTYANLASSVTQSHIHIGAPGTSGGISIWLCGTAALPGPVGTPTCSGTVTGNASGTINAASVIGPTGQLVNAAELAEVIRMIRNGSAYVNVHTSGVPGGEIRGLIR
jgi:hypothetical protein